MNTRRNRRTLTRKNRKATRKMNRKMNRKSRKNTRRGGGHICDDWSSMGYNSRGECVKNQN